MKTTVLTTVTLRVVIAYLTQPGNAALAPLAEQLLTLIQSRLAQLPMPDETFARLRSTPTDPQVQKAARARLNELLRRDTAFAAALEALLREAGEIAVEPVPPSPLEPVPLFPQEVYHPRRELPDVIAPRLSPTAGPTTDRPTMTRGGGHVARGEGADRAMPSPGIPTRGTGRPARPAVGEVEGRRRSRPRTAAPSRREAAAPPGEPTPAWFSETSFPAEVALGETAPLVVGVSREQVAGHEVELAITTAPGQPTELMVVVTRASGFHILGKTYGPVVIEPDGKVQKALFQLQAALVGEQQIAIEYFQGTRDLGEVVITTQIRPAVAAGSPVTHWAAIPRADDVTVSEPDLVMLIVEKEKERVYQVILNARDRQLGLVFDSGDIEFRGNPAEKFRERFADIEALGQYDPATVAEMLSDKGTALYRELLPASLQERFWAARERITSIEIISDEPWIPWELLKPVHKEPSGRVVTDPFLAERYAIGRWQRGVDRRGKATLRLHRARLIAPSDTRLPAVQAEQTFLFKLLKTAGCQVEKVPPTYTEVKRLLKTGGFDLLHVSCHGQFNATNPNHSAILLQDGVPLAADALTGEGANFGLEHPLVFLNACQTGQRAFTLTGMGGWAKQCLEVGCSAFIGTLWSVDDEQARRFVQELYPRLLRKEPLGYALRDARQALKASGDPTWLAYTLYGDPAARVG